MVPAKQQKDVLELARSQLDFAAIAAEAPSAKEILYKAQTIVPLKPAKPWRRIATATGALLMLVIMAFTPWLPERASVSLMKISFEQAIDYQDAYELISHFARAIPELVLIGVEMSEPAADSNAAGHLAIRLSSVSHSPAQLREFAEGAVSESGYQIMYQVLSGQINRTGWSSPVSRLRQLFSRQKDQTVHGMSRLLARTILSREIVFAEGLQGQLNQLGYDMEDFGFIGGRQDAGARYDFVVDCWPADVGISVRHYQDLMDHEQDAIQQRAEEYLETVNLRNRGLALIREPQLWLPIVVDVYEGEGQQNPQLTGRVQAWVMQPEPAEMISLDFDPLDNVRRAVERAMPGYECRLDYMRNSGPSSNTARLYKIKVTIVGAKARSLGDLAVDVQDSAELEY